MTNKEIELKLDLIYEKLLKYDLLDYLEWQENKESTMKDIRNDVLDLYKYYRDIKNNNKVMTIHN